MNKLEKNSKKIIQFLDQNNITYQSSISTPVAPTGTIWTPKCTIELYKGNITVNEIACDDVETTTSVIAKAEHIPMEQCTFCGRESETENTKHVGGYTILDHCTDCEAEILEDKED